MREQRTQNNMTREVALVGRRNKKAADNSLRFLARVEGVECDGHIRGANGMKWRVA